MASYPMTDQFRGRLEVFGLADLLQWMELNRRSGRLIVTRGHDRRTLDWKEGEIVYVSGSLPRHRLGVHLLRSGSMPAATLYELLARNMTTQENLTRLILEMGHDTLDGLSLRVEDLARKLLFEIFEWREADFEYDPSYRVTPILRIGLTLRGQALAFQGVKQLDDTHRLSRRERRENWEAADAWILPFLPEGIEEHLWEALERMGDAHIDPAEGREHSSRFREFARRLKDRLIRNYLMRPIYSDTAELLLELLKKSPVDPESVVPVAALDQYLSLDLLILANSLSVDRENSVGTVPDAVARIGPRALTVLIDRLSSPDFPALPRNDPAARAVRRASLAAAIAGGRFAERYGITRERGYTLGLLHCIAYADLFEIVREMNLPAGPFRGAVLETYRPAVGRSRAEIWGLPRDFEAVLSDDGTDPAAAAALVRKARSAIAGCAIGGLPVEAGGDVESDELTAELNMLFDYLGLEAVGVARE
jgi:hypothetical protein